MSLRHLLVIENPLKRHNTEGSDGSVKSETITTIDLRLNESDFSVVLFGPKERFPAPRSLLQT